MLDGTEEVEDDDEEVTLPEREGVASLTRSPVPG